MPEIRDRKTDVRRQMPEIRRPTALSPIEHPVTNLKRIAKASGEQDTETGYQMPATIQP